MKNRILTFIGFVLLWEIIAATTDETFFVSLPRAFGALGELFVQHGLLLDIWASFRRILFALLAVFILAVPLGISIGRSKFSEQITEPLTRFLRYIPAPTLIPLTIVWFGVGEIAKIFIIFWGIFFVVLLSIRDSAEQVPADYILAAKSMGYSQFQTLRKVIFPSIAPDIWNALRIAWGESWIYLLIAEMIAADNGIGKTLIVAQRFLRVDQIFGVLLLLGFLGFFSDLGFRFTRRRLFPHKYST